MNEKEILNNLGERKRVKNSLEDLNFSLLLHTVLSNLIWVFIFMLIAFVLASAYLRWTPDTYETQAVLMSKPAKEAQVLGFEKLLKDDRNEIQLEIQLMRSKFLIGRAVDSLNINTEYFLKGRMRNTEYFKNNPFEAKIHLLNSAFDGKDISIQWISEKKYNIIYTDLEGNEQVHEAFFNQKYQNKDFSLQINTPDKKIIDQLLGRTFVVRYKTDATLVNEILSKVQVFPTMSGSRTIKIVYEYTDAQKAKEIVEAIGNEFIRYDKEKKTESINNIIAFLDEQIQNYNIEFKAFQDSVRLMRIKSGFIKPNEKVNRLLEGIETINLKLADIEFSNKNLLWLSNYIANEGSFSSMSTILLSGEVEKFSAQISQIANIEQERKYKLIDVTEDHPQVVLIDNQLSTLRNNLQQQVNLLLNNSDTEKTKLQKEKQKIYTELYSIPENEIKYNRIANENSIKEGFLNNMLNSKANYLIAKAGILSDYIYLQKATINRKPVAPNRSAIKIASLLFGLVLGFILILVRYLLHNEVVSVEEIKENTNANVLGAIPYFKNATKHSQVVIGENPKSSIAEAFRGIRTNLDFINAEKKSKLVVTTSTIPGEGKTFIGANLAAAFSLLNKKVVFVDFDLRKPRLDKVFNVDNQKGVSTILIGKSSIDECIHQSKEMPNLYFITSGPVPPNPAELIIQNPTQELIDELKKEFDYVFLDTPPTGLVTDAVSLLKRADYPIYVVRADYSKRSFLANVNNLIFDNKIHKLSVVLNDFGQGASKSQYGGGYGYGAGYGYGYGYGKGYYTDDEETRQTWKYKLSKLFKRKKR